MDYYLNFGLIMGLAAGFAPGPLLTLVISETLQHGIKDGLKVAVAPIITDAPIVIAILLLVVQVSDFDAVIGILSLLGGCYVLYMAYEGARAKQVAAHDGEVKSKSLLKGILVNMLSPHPYIFWLLVGAPTIIKAAGVNSVAPALFIAGFYLPLVGSKVLLAVLVGKYKSFLGGHSYRYIMLFLSLLLAIFAVMLFVDGLRLLGVLENAATVS